MARELPFDLLSLRIFTEICETGSMAHAAIRMGLTQPAISQTIKQLESRLGVQLFDRSLRPIGLTPAGVMLRERAYSLLDDARQLGIVLRQSAKSSFAIVRMGITESVVQLLAAVLAAEIKGVAQRSSFRMGSAQYHVEAFFRRRLEFLVSVDPLENIDDLERYLIADEPFIIIVPPDTPEAVSNVSQVAESGLPLIKYSHDSYTGMALERHLRRLAIRPEGSQDFDTSRAVVEMVAQGMGWTIATPLCLVGMRAASGSVKVLPAPVGIRRGLNLISRAGEFGGLPKLLAARCTETMATQIYPEIAAHAPWIALGAPTGTNFHVPELHL